MDKCLLNLGCGRAVHPDWRNLDIVPLVDGVQACDLSKGIPFDAESADAVYHSHVLEHLRTPDAESFLTECHRVLRPGGILRIAVPDLEGICRAYLRALESSSDEDHHWMQLELLDQTTRERSGGQIAETLKAPDLPNESFVYDRVGTEARELREILLGKASPPKQVAATKTTSGWKAKIRAFLMDRCLTASQWKELRVGNFRLGGEVHQWMYDRRSLAALLAKTGFQDIRTCTATESGIPLWNEHGLDLDDQGRPRKPDSLYMEAVK